MKCLLTGPEGDIVLEHGAKTTPSKPMHPDLTRRQTEYVVEVIASRTDGATYDQGGGL